MHTLVMPESEEGFIGILIVLDLFTHYVFLYPLQSHNAMSTAECLLQTFAIGGIPDQVYSDQGIEVDNKVMNILTSSLLIRHAFALVKSHVGAGEVDCKTVLNKVLK